MPWEGVGQGFVPDKNPVREQRDGRGYCDSLCLEAKVDSKPVMRAYTPMTDDSTKGHVDLLVTPSCKNVTSEGFIPKTTPRLRAC